MIRIVKTTTTASGEPVRIYGEPLQVPGSSITRYWAVYRNRAGRFQPNAVAWAVTGSHSSRYLTTYRTVRETRETRETREAWAAANL